MIALAAASFVCAIVLQVAFGGFAFVPVSDQSELNIAVETPPGSSLDYTTLKAEEIARLIRARIAKSRTRTPRWAARRGVVGRSDNATHLRAARAEARALDQPGQLRPAPAHRRCAHVGGATAYTFASAASAAQSESSCSSSSRVPTQTVAQRYAEPIAESVRGDAGRGRRRAVDEGTEAGVQRRVNRGLAGTLGVSRGQLAQSLRFAFAGVDAGTWVDPAGISRYVHVRLAAVGARECRRPRPTAGHRRAGASRRGRHGWRDAAVRAAQPGRGRSRRATGRRRSTTTSASAS